MDDDKDDLAFDKADFEALPVESRLSLQMAVMVQTGARAVVHEVAGSAPSNVQGDRGRNYRKLVEIATLLMLTSILDGLNHFCGLTAQEAAAMGATYTQIAEAARISRQAARKQWPNITEVRGSRQGSAWRSRTVDLSARSPAPQLSRLILQ